MAARKPRGTGKTKRRRGETADATCRQPTCGCRGDPKLGGYCSPYCSAADHTDVQQGACSCGHSACIEHQEAAFQARQRETVIAIGPR